MTRSLWLTVFGLVIVLGIPVGAMGRSEGFATASPLGIRAPESSETNGRVDESDHITVAVLEFGGTGYVNIPIWLRDRLASGIPQMIAGRLLHEPGVRVLERERINDIMQEHRLQSSQSIDESTAIRLGRLAGADVLVMGTLSEIGIESGGGVGVGRFQLNTVTAKVRLSGSMVAVETGELVAAIESQGQSTGSGISIRNIQGLSYDGKDFQDSIIGKALDEAIDDFVAKFQTALSGARGRLANSGAPVISGKIVGLRGEYVIVDLGRIHGVQTRSQLKVERLEHIEGLPAPIHIPVATLEVLSVDEHACVTTASNNRESISIGDRVEILR